MSSHITPSSTSSSASDRLPPDAQPSPHPNAGDYAKDDVDTSPPSSSVYAVDPSCENVQPAHDAPTSGQVNEKSRWEDQYENVSRDKPYDVPTPSQETRSPRNGSNGEEEKLRYGGRKRWASEKGHEVSPPAEGPTGTEKGGRKPEGI
ncbi:hypothetical protein EDC04DRAFT_2564471 [Pisolithus marmoratus]|nr:hypothetical protein EDC04DRAFT_2564471 [Pisolithus marmoratus]